MRHRTCKEISHNCVTLYWLGDRNELCEISSFLIMVVLLSPAGFNFALHPVPPSESANQPLQVRQQQDSSPACESVVDSSSSYELPLENGVAQPNLWGLDSATGSVEQCYGTNGLQTSIQLSARESRFATSCTVTDVNSLECRNAIYFRQVFDGPVENQYFTPLDVSRTIWSLSMPPSDRSETGKSKQV